MDSEGCFSVVYLLYEHSGCYRLITAAFLHAGRSSICSNNMLAALLLRRCGGKMPWKGARFLIRYLGFCDFRNSAFLRLMSFSTGKLLCIDREPGGAGFRAGPGGVAFLVIVKKGEAGCGGIIPEKSGIRRCPVSVS